ncbi:cytochrome P450 [Amycolatopsis acidicola]|uniref:Cytochrome P450 n=1 Tax=Amycolatopsis acidicola TaxID=2596893 RepID=A0A5N0UU52_9PSEU|nr:cytochrome P450 [Amycolatopsis acidicola]KAA9154927.1 cytochrome P450 [Amycolatopsis acidicola]
MNAARSALVWAIRYGVPGLALRTAARRGDLIAGTTADPAVRADPFPAYDAIRARGPLVRNRVVNATATHSVASAVLRSEEFLVAPSAAPTSWLGVLSAAALDPRALGPTDPPSLLAIQPPDHTRLRRLVSRAFTARAVSGFTERIREIADGLLDDIAGRTAPTFDLIESYAALVPVTVIAEIIGVPAAMRRQFLAWGNEAALTLDPGLSWRDYRSAERALRASHRWLAEHIASLRRSPSNEMLGDLVHLVDDGDRLTDTELRATALLLLGAGFETTVNLIGNAVALLLEHPEQLARLREDPSGWDNAVEEVLRYDSPVQVTVRTARSTTEVAGVRVREGSNVLVMLGGANRDPAVFEDPHTFDVTRGNARDHLAFSAGIHYCLGASLARLEAGIALRALFERFPGLSAAGAPTRRGTRVLRGYQALPLSS